MGPARKREVTAHTTPHNKYAHGAMHLGRPFRAPLPPSAQTDDLSKARVAHHAVHHLLQGPEGRAPDSAEPDRAGQGNSARAPALMDVHPRRLARITEKQRPPSRPILCRSREGKNLRPCLDRQSRQASPCNISENRHACHLLARQIPAPDVQAP